MRRFAFTALLALFSTPAFAQAAPYKLVIVWYQSSLTVIDYPSAARCEAARKAVMDEVKRRNEQADAEMPPGAVRIGRSPNSAFCIPG